MFSDLRKQETQRKETVHKSTSGQVDKQKSPQVDKSTNPQPNITTSGEVHKPTSGKRNKPAKLQVEKYTGSPAGSGKKG